MQYRKERQPWLNLVREIMTRQESKLFHSRLLRCYSCELVKKKENEIFQHLATAPYIQFICHPWIIDHPPMYYANHASWSYTPQTWMLSTQPRHIIRYRNTSDHIVIVPNNPSAIPVSSHISACLSHQFLRKTDSSQSIPITHDLGCDTICDQPKPLASWTHSTTGRICGNRLFNTYGIALAARGQGAHNNWHLQFFKHFLSQRDLGKICSWTVYGD